MNDYKNIKTKEDYQKTIDSGMFWEFYPELTGNWDVDKVTIFKNCQKYLVRPNDYHIFEIDEFNGCYRSYTNSDITRGDSTKPNAQKHFTYENLTKNYDFFPITEEEISMYEEKNNQYCDFISWQNRSDGHGGVKGGIFEEFLTSKYNKAFNNPNSFALTTENIDKNIDKNIERYKFLAENVKFQINYIDDYYTFDFDNLEQTLTEMKKLQLIFKWTNRIRKFKNRK